MAERGTSLGVQWLRFCTAEGTSSMGWGTRGAKTKILHGMAKQKEKKEKKIAEGTQHFFPWLSGLTLLS